MKKVLLIFILLIIGIPKINAEPITDKINNLQSNVTNLSSQINSLNNINKLYPIGSIYMTVTNTNPSTIIGGTWDAYGQGRKIVGVGSNGTTNYSYNSSGGSSTKQLAVTNLPAHTHTITPSGTVTSTFSGKSVNTNSTGAHTHTEPFGKASDEAKGYGLREGVSQTSPNTWDVIFISSNYPVATGSSGSHTHTMTSSGTVSSTFTGSSATTSSVGSTSSFSIQNPYITVYMWKRTA